MRGTPTEARARLEALVGPLQHFEANQDWEAEMQAIDIADDAKARRYG